MNSLILLLQKQQLSNLVAKLPVRAGSPRQELSAKTCRGIDSVNHLRVLRYMLLPVAL